VSDNDQSIGFIGLGALGSVMVQVLLQSGARVHVTDTNALALGRAVAQGAIAESSARAVADTASLVFACLPSPEASLDVALGAGGVKLGTAVKVYAELSTIGRTSMQDIASGLKAHGISVVDAPVSGGPKGATAQTLSLMLAGEEAAKEAVRHALRPVTGKSFDLGNEPGMAQVMKLANNMISIAAMTASFEVMVMGTKAGLDPKVMLDVLNASSARNTATSKMIPEAIIPRTFDYGARLAVSYKDLSAGLKEAQSLGAPMWFLAGAHQVWNYAMTHGAGEQDFTTLIKFYEEWAGVEVK